MDAVHRSHSRAASVYTLAIQKNRTLKETNMSKAYFISTYHAVHDADALAAYAKLALPAIQAAGGTFLARGMPAMVKEHGQMQRTVLIEFPHLEAAKAAYDSAGYKEALAALGTNAVERDIRIIEGV
jgi:uncharacterized protein (DUF1330 family)